MTDADSGAASEFEQRLGHFFRDRALLEVALTHASFAHERDGCESYERLEFLGDSVLGLVVADLLYGAHPDWAEGELSRALASLVDRRSLARWAREIELGGDLRLGRTERLSGGETKSSILADAMEAVIGAIYLDAGLAAVRELVRAHFAPALAPGARPVGRDPKTALQERLMSERGALPSYRIARDSGVEGDDERFTAEVVFEGEILGAGVGRSKQRAERAAARATLARLAEACGPAGAGRDRNVR